MVLKLTGDDAVEKKPLFSLEASRGPEYTSGYVGEVSSKLHLALGEDSPGVQDLQTAFVTGSQERYKRLLADQEILRQQTARNDVLTDISSVSPESVTPEMVEIVQGLSVQEMQDPDLSDIIERRYAQVYTNVGTAAEENGIIAEAEENEPEDLYMGMDRLEGIAYKNQMIATKAAEIAKNIEDQSWGSYIWDFTERMIPFVDWYQMHGQVGEDSEMVTSILPGSNLEEQYTYLWNLPPKRFQEEVSRAMDDLSSRNYQTAMTWLQGLKSFGGSDAFLNNAFAVTDVADLTVGLAVKPVVGVLKGLAKGSIKSPTSLEQIATAAGRFEDGAMGRVVKDLEEGSLVGGSEIRKFKDLEDSVPSLSSPNDMLVGSQNLPKEAYLRMKEALRNNAELARRFLAEPNLIDRASPEELVRYRDVLRDEYVRDNPSVQKNVLDIEILPEADAGNVYNAKIVLGKRDGTLFESEAQARNYFKRHIRNTDDFTVTQVGQGFQIEILKSVDESRFISDAFRISTDQTTPESFANTFGGWFRSSNYVISKDASRAASTGVTSMENMKGMFEEMASSLTSLPKGQMSELSDLMIVNRQKQEYFKNYGELEQAFFDRFKKNPTPEQAEAYFTYVQMNDLDLVIRDLDWYKQKAIQGREEISLRVGAEDLAFEGRRVDDLPNVSDAINERYKWTIIHPDGTKEKTRSSMGLRASHREEIERLKGEGYKIYQVADQQFKVGEKEYTGFVITKGERRNRVGVKNVDRKPGGHKVDTYTGYIKQGKVSRTEDGLSALYRGDTTLFGVKTQKEGEDFIKLLNEGRERLLRNDKDAYVWIRDNLPIDSQRFIRAVEKGDIDLTVPFSYTPKGIRSIDTGALSGIQGLEDLGSNVHNLDAQILGRYSGSRDMSDIDVIRSEGNMQFEVRDAEYLDPITTLRMSSQDVISQRTMNDYTAMTTRNFIREFSDILEGSLEEQLTGGVEVLANPRFKSGADRTAASRVAAAQNVSRAYRNLMNHGTALDRKIDSYKDKIVGSIYPRVGPRGQQWLDERAMWGAKDPGVFLRSVAFHSKLGLFNPNQLFVQANALVNVASVGGANGLRGGMAYPLFRAGVNVNDPAKIKAMAKVIGKTGLMKADEFEESLRLYKKSGYNSIGKDTAFLDDISGPEINTKGPGGVGKKFLDYGTVPFKEGERVVRMAAWNTAYLEKKAQLGGRAITRRDEADILSRAKLLSVDMTRESNATWQKGYAAVFTQFFSFQARLSEQMLGKRLTAAEKGRLFLGYSAMYGAPTAAGATLGVLPFRDIVMDSLYGMGVDPTQEEWRPLVDGFANMIVEQITGKDLNISDRYGAGGIPLVYDLLRGDQGLLETLVGASGGIMGDIISDTIPAVGAIYREVFAEGATKEEMVAPLRNISSFNSAWQMYQVYNLGIWASKNEVNLMEMDLPDALIAALTGLQPSELGAGFRRGNAMRGWKEEKEQAQRDLTKEYIRIIRMEPSPERESLTNSFRAKLNLGGFTEKERWEIVRNATSDKSVNERTWERWELELQRKQQRGNNGG